MPHKRLLLKQEKYEVSGTKQGWIQNFLRQITEAVLLDGHASSALDVLSGVQKRYRLLLFLAYINNLQEWTNSDARLFADDCLLYI